MGGGNAQKSAMARKKAQEKAAKEGKGARAPQPTPRAHPRSPPQFSNHRFRLFPHRRQPAQAERRRAEHPVQGVHGDVHLHHCRGQAQGARRQQAPQERLPPMFSPLEGVSCETCSRYTRALRQEKSRAVGSDRVRRSRPRGSITLGDELETGVCKAAETQAIATWLGHNYYIQ